MAATDYPLPVFHFKVEWGGVKAEFSEVTGLNAEAQIIEYKHGMSRDHGAIKMPGVKKYGNVTLKRGVFKADNQYFDWWNSIEMNEVERRDVTIKLLDEKHQPVMTWKLAKAWPTKIEGPGLKGDGNEVAVESMEIAHEGLRIENR